MERIVTRLTKTTSLDTPSNLEKGVCSAGTAPEAGGDRMLRLSIYGG